MTGLLSGLGVGVGLFLIWWSCWVPRPAAVEVTRARSGPVARLRDEVVQAGFAGLTVRALLLACAIAFFLVLAIVWLTVGVAPIAVCFATMAGGAPVALVRRRARRRRAVLRELWPDAVDNITSAVRAGMALPEALGQLGERGPEPLREPFRRFADDYRLTGRFSDCLDRLKERLSDPVADRLVESLRIAREVGGSDLGRLLRTLSGFLREDARTRAELETRQSWTVNAARLAVAAPWFVLVMLSTRPESVAAYASVTGAVVLAAGAAVTAVAYALMVRIGRLPDERRVLR
ncbi:type II secretion system F family protein [Phycicoccus endophyticus]|uniref:Type II secretion system F family protein n=1 Tax=Phycicoccus endophyticus TaxID=1690220 RepID=A0A7G9R380_9MICO|nr:type II secretion system F family protein [Phycicoccus endophyticus]NHI19796.1 type II secretion system protein F [Phycicoccus endophyticus]QNN50055.1 type II secretion system F family protein [Phycicoccus endophyticus]GGL28525.1 type II secretion system protein F [Phycicoccus endophyticus]